VVTGVGRVCRAGTGRSAAIGIRIAVAVARAVPVPAPLPVAVPVAVPVAGGADQRAVAVVHQQLRLAADHDGGVVRVGLDAVAGVAHGAPDDLLADRVALHLIAAE
jgi:hypothetical protein